MLEESSSISANKVHETYRGSLLEIADMLKPYPFLREKENGLRDIAANLQSPFNIAIFGRMKTGKSSIINALLGRSLAIIGVDETTATINRITYATGERLNEFTVHWTDAQPETFPLNRLQEDWTGKNASVLNRIKRAWLELYSDNPILKDIHITDTPGTGAAVASHEEVAQQFINGQVADALLYVFSPNGREDDEKDLSAFRAGCIPGASLDNSLGILHQWDYIYWGSDSFEEIETKASRVHNAMQKLVSAVVPVSAPLALLVKTAPASFWDKCRTLMKAFPTWEDFKLLLQKTDRYWRKENSDLYEIYREAKTLGCPMDCFRVMLRHLYRNEGNVTAVLELSGFPKLEKILDKNIFTKRSVIQQSTNSGRARRILDDIYKEIEHKLQRYDDDKKTALRILELIQGKDENAEKWMKLLRAQMHEEQLFLESQYEKIDCLRIRVKEWSEAIVAVHELQPHLAELGFVGRNHELVSAMLNSLLPNADPLDMNNEEIYDVVRRQVNGVLSSPCQQNYKYAEILEDCLSQWLSKTLNEIK